MSRIEGESRVEQTPCFPVADGVIHQPTDEYTPENRKSQTMKGYNMEDNPLVMGGCGHTAEELENSALICTVCFVLILALVIASAILA